MRRTRVPYDLHGAVEGKKNRKAYLRGILPCSETSPAYSSALSAKSPYVSPSREFAGDDAVGPNRLDGGECFKAVTVDS